MSYDQPRGGRVLCRFSFFLCLPAENHVITLKDLDVFARNDAKDGLASLNPPHDVCARGVPP